jgi:cytochrome c
MKKLYVLVLAASFVFASCGGKKEEPKKEEGDAYNDYETAEPAAPKEETSTDLIAQGQALLNASDCKTCHGIDNKIVGPGYKDVAAKYEFTKANVGMLADKVVAGGTGSWGQIPMTAHPDIPKADAEKMVMYVLSLDGEQPKD